MFPKSSTAMGGVVVPSAWGEKGGPRRGPQKGRQGRIRTAAPMPQSIFVGWYGDTAGGAFSVIAMGEAAVASCSRGASVGRTAGPLVLAIIGSTIRYPRPR